MPGSLAPPFLFWAGSKHLAESQYLKWQVNNKIYMIMIIIIFCNILYEYTWILQLGQLPGFVHILICPPNPSNCQESFSSLHAVELAAAALLPIVGSPSLDVPLNHEAPARRVATWGTYYISMTTGFGGWAISKHQYVKFSWQIKIW